ncbi:stimulated by retinoic acid gene 8 protein homolog isoform X4 [Melanerpes formicivorus]|uniref:stimulated by retinoic acid gene 8 protein homolog isoform X4 n=1 Tax=Melanerpes formicivorus TaxID=211600 RepID=UPI00358F6602
MAMVVLGPGVDSIIFVVFSNQTSSTIVWLQPLMETAGNCRKKHARVRPAPLTQLQEAELCAAKQHLSQPHQRAVLTGLFISLQEAVLSRSDSSASKYQVLRKAKKVIQKLEQTLGSLLKMKAESFSLEDGNPSSLEEVREEYVKRHFSNHRYLHFYKHTVDLLIEHEIVCTEELPLPEVSTAISHFWQELSEERRDSILQYCSQRDFLMDPKPACQEPLCTAGSMRDSRGDSEEASGSSVSTPEEVKFEDAFDVVAAFLDRSEPQGVSSQSSAPAECTPENAVDQHRLHLQITDFLKSLFFPSAQFCQEEDLQFDYVTVMLRCTETFDDEDF